MNRQASQELILAEAWSIVADELVVIAREGGHTQWVVNFMDGGM